MSIANGATLVMHIKSISIIVLMGFSAICFSDEQISFLSHQEKLNSKLCDTLVSCRKGSTKGQCLTHMNALSQANPNNKKIKVYQNASNHCLSSLANITCQNALEKSINGPCALKSLQTESAEAEPVTIKDEKALPKLSQKPKEPVLKINKVEHTVKKPQVSIEPAKPKVVLKAPKLVSEAQAKPEPKVVQKPAEKIKPLSLPEESQPIFNKKLGVGDKAKVEFNNQWYPAIVLQTKVANKHRFYQIKFIQSGIEAWVAPNRIMSFHRSKAKNVVGNAPYQGHFSLGKKVRAEYDGKWYPAVLLEKKKFLDSTTYKIQYKTNGIIEWVAENRIKD